MSMPDPVARLNAALSGRYVIERQLGEGGMATVYLAQDLKHRRQVALKVLKPELAAVVGAQRFLAEIETTAHLNHPHILPLHDSGEADSFLFYVMPYVEGESLRDRLDRERQLPVDEAVRIATAVANALDHAHRHGVIHRDIKPANILLQDSEPLIADFGIALAVGAAGGNRLTETGLSLGTPYYMSPEQASGDQKVGPATDTYALACVLYEMLVAEPPYTGSSAQAILGKIIAGQAASVTAQRKTVPANVDAAIAKALQKLPADRFAATQDFARALGDPGFGLGAETGATEVDQRRRVALGLAVTMTALAAAAGVTIGRLLAPSGDVPATPAVFVIDLPPEAPLAPADLSAVAISSNSRHIVYTGQTEFGTRLFRRDINALAVTPINGTDGAVGPFFSPDGAWVGFFASGKLKKVRIEGGAVTELADAALARGGSWATNDTIYFTSAPGTGLWAVHANGGPARLLTQLDTARGERTHRLPQAMPDARSVVFTAREGGHATFDDARIERFSMDDRTRSVILEGGSHGRILPTGQFVFVREGALNASSLAAGVSAPSVVIDSVVTDPSTGAAHYAVSDDGTLVYARGGPWVPERAMMLLGPNVRSTPLSTATGPFREPRFAPGGDAVAVVSEGASDDIWIYRIEDGSLRRFTFEGGSHIAPLWSPDGSRIAFSSNRAGRYNLYLKNADGSGEVERLAESELIQFPSDWLPDGSTVAFTQISPETGTDVWTVALEGGEPVPLLQNGYNEFGAVFHPSMPWIAYVSDETGTDQVYVARYPTGGSRQQVSLDGGVDPVWGADGTRLYYRRGQSVLSALIRLEPEFRVSNLQTEVQLPRQGVTVTSVRTYDVAPNGQGFLAIEERDLHPPTRIHVMLNFFGELKRGVSR